MDGYNMTGDEITFSIMPQALELEDAYFTDMTLADFPEVMDALDERGESWLSPCVEKVRFYELKESADGTTGAYDPKSKAIGVLDGMDVTTLMHEMIHMYEHQIDELNPSIRQYLAVKIWEKICPQVTDLEARILGHLEPVGLRELENWGGQHDVLFLLKSYDIDLQLGLKLGTTMGYGCDSSE